MIACGIRPSRNNGGKSLRFTFYIFSFYFIMFPNIINVTDRNWIPNKHYYVSDLGPLSQYWHFLWSLVMQIFWISHNKTSLQWRTQKFLEGLLEAKRKNFSTFFANKFDISITESLCNYNVDCKRGVLKAPSTRPLWVRYCSPS